MSGWEIVERIFALIGFLFILGSIVVWSILGILKRRDKRKRYSDSEIRNVKFLFPQIDSCQIKEKIIEFGLPEDTSKEEVCIICKDRGRQTIAINLGLESSASYEEIEIICKNRDLAAKRAWLGLPNTCSEEDILNEMKIREMEMNFNNC